MLSIALSILVALLVGGAVYPIFWTWYAPIPPALLAGGLTFYLLVRWRTNRVQAEMQQLPALLQNRQLDQAEALLDGIVARHARWVLLLENQIAVQKGMLRYAQMKWDEARPLLQKGQWQNWQAHTALGAIAWRQDAPDTAWTHLDKAESAGGKEPMPYLVHAVLAVRSGDRERALRALARGLDKNPDAKPLKALRKRIANKKRIDVKQLPQTWYHFFPEDLLKQMMVRGRKGGPPDLPPGVTPRYQQPFPQPRGASKKMRRG